MNVPKYGGQKVETQAIAPIRANVNAPIEAFGGGGANPGEAISKTLDAGAKYFQAEKQNADNFAVKVYGKKSAQDFHMAQYSADGAFQSQGLNAMEAAKNLDDNFKKLKSEAVGKASNEDQRIMISNTWDDEYSQMQKTMSIHEATQRREAEVNATKAVNENSQNFAAINYRDQAVFEKSLLDQAKSIHQHGSSNGAYSDTTNKEINKAWSDTGFSVIQRYVDNNDMEGAKRFYDKNGKVFTTKEDLHKVSELLKEGSKKSEAIKASNDIVSQYNDTYAALKAAEEKYKDPSQAETLELTQTMIKAKMKEKNEAPLRVYDNRLMQAVDSIDKTGDVAPSISDGLLPDGKRAAQNYALYKRGLLKVDPTNSTYLDYSNMSMQELADVPQSTMIMKVKTTTTPEQFKTISEKWQIARDGKNGDPGAKSKWNSTSEDHQSMLTSLKDAGIISDGLSMEQVNKNTKSRKVFINTWNDTAAEIDKAMANRGGKPLADEERKAIMNQVVNRTVKTAGYIFGTNESRAVEINVDDDNSIKKVYLEPTEKAQMIQAAKVNGLIPMNTSPSQAETMLGTGMRKAKLYAIKNGAFDTDEKAKTLVDILRGNKK